MRYRDGDWHLIDHRPKEGKTTWGRENADGTTTVRTDHHVDAVVDANTAIRNMTRPDWHGDYHLIASVPQAVFYDQLHGASLQKDDRYISKWLNDSDNRAWRTKDGVI